MRIFYLGAFPPGYGGVTIKNRNLYQALSQQMPIEKIDFNRIKRRDFRELFRFVFVLMRRKNRFVIGVSGRKTRKRLTQVLYYLNRKAMGRSVLMVMGGTAAEDMAADPEYRKCVAGYKKIYVETEGMMQTLLDAGVANVGVYPNGRFRWQQTRVEAPSGMPLKCVFFSLIQPEKGVDLILQVAPQLPDVQFEFFGKIVKEYEEKFLAETERHPNVFYKGLFTGSSEEVYTELGRYDVLLLPTRWIAEGVPGVLVEAKIAGITSIVTDHNFNSEVVTDGADGIIMTENTTEGLLEAIDSLNRDRNLLQKLKEGSLASAENYYIENYVPEIVNQMR